MFRLLPLILRNVLRNRRRSLLTLASTAVSLAVLTLMCAMYQGFFYGEDATPSDARRMISRHRVSLTQVLPASHQSRIEAVPGVEITSAWTWFQGVYKDPQDFFARFAVDNSRIFDIRQDWTIEPVQLAAFKNSRTGCAIARQISEKYKIGIGDRVTIVGDIYDVTLELTCVAIFDCPETAQCLVFNREYLTELLPAGSSTRDAVGTYIMLADNPDNVPRIGRAVDALFENSPYPTRTESEKEFGRSFLAFLGNIKLFLAAICGAVTFTILLVSANTISMSVRERTRETAVLRTLGYTPGEILGLVLIESALLSVIGGVIGIGLGALLTEGMRAGSGGFIAQGLRWEAAVIVLGMAAIIGVLASIVPAVVASKKNVVESLRFTG